MNESRWFWVVAGGFILILLLIVVMLAYGHFMGLHDPYLMIPIK